LIISLIGLFGEIRAEKRLLGLAMDVRSLEIFVEVATYGGFNRAASKLNIAQSALSRRIANLEHEIGTQLLERSKRGVKLTAAGSLLLDRSQSLLRHFDQVRAEMLAEAQEPRGELALGLPPSLQFDTSRMLATLRARYPGLFIRAWTATSVELRSLLLSGKLDLIVYATIDAETLLATHLLFTEPLLIIGPGGATMVEEAHCEMLADLPLILTSRPNSVRMLIEAWAARYHVKLNVVMEINDVPLTLRLVEEGAGFAILPNSAMAIRDPARLSRRVIPELQLSWAIAYSKEKPLSMANKCAIEVIREMIVRPTK
jgi:LysR family nitrogen assimilation transcriptional regulator